MTDIPPGAVQAVAAKLRAIRPTGTFDGCEDEVARELLEAAEAVWPHIPDHYPGGASVDEGVRDDRRRDATS